MAANCVAVELTPQTQATHLADLAGWVLAEQATVVTLTAAGCTRDEVRLIMRADDSGVC